jgi:hypothetical protein
MTIQQLVAMAQRIHDAEGWNLGASSTRETRNAFFGRVVGFAHWGGTFNPTPDPQWHCKDPDGPGGGRPMSDDVAVSMPTRKAWDVITGAGADNYRFEASEPFYLPLDQFVFVPAKPADSGAPPAPPLPPAPKPYPGDAYFVSAIGVPLEADYALAGQRLDAGSATWFSRTIWRHVNEGMTMDASVAQSRKEWRAALGLPPA